MTIKLKFLSYRLHRISRFIVSNSANCTRHLPSLPCHYKLVVYKNSENESAARKAVI